MRLYLIIAITGLLFNSCTQTTDNKNVQSKYKSGFDTSDATNDFYDNAPTYQLKHQKKIIVDGEIKGTTKQKFRDFQKRSVIVKETLLNSKRDSFVGAYKYKGYSLYDILNEINIDKKNKKEFPPIIDLYVEISNSNGEKTLLSWGEIFYPKNRHKNIIATHVTPIIPSKTKEKWPIPEQSKLIVATDLLTERNITNPTRITVRSLTGNYHDKEMDILYSPVVKVKNGENKTVSRLSDMPDKFNKSSCPNVFYGRGKGIHGVTTFEGYLLKNILNTEIPQTKERLREGLFSISAPDGYRAAFSYSEIFNRNDQSEVFLIDLGENEPGGKFRVFTSADFFSDRAIKAVSEIHYKKPD